MIKVLQETKHSLVAALKNKLEKMFYNLTGNKDIFYSFNREAERERMEQYEKELQEMKERLDQRPLLFEQESQVYATIYFVFQHAHPVLNSESN